MGTLGDAPDAAQRWDYRKPDALSGATMVVQMRAEAESDGELDDGT